MRAHGGRRRQAGREARRHQARIARTTPRAACASSSRRSRATTPRAAAQARSCPPGVGDRRARRRRAQVQGPRREEERHRRAAAQDRLRRQRRGERRQRRPLGRAHGAGLRRRRGADPGGAPHRARPARRAPWRCSASARASSARPPRRSSEPLFLKDAERLARLRSHAGSTVGMGDPLVLAMLLETAGHVHLH